MKKMFTLLALLACFLGANAQQWEQVFKTNYSAFSEFPYYIMGYAPDMIDGIMVDNPQPYRKLWRDSDEGFADVEGECTQVTINNGTYYLQSLTSNPWRQYFIADGIGIEIGASYKVVAMVKASDAVTINVNLGPWGGEKGASVTIPASDDFQEVEWTYEDMPASGGNSHLCAQPGVTDVSIEWQSVIVYQKVKQGGKPKEWIEDIENGDAEKSWSELGLADVRFDDMENNFKICAWGKERMVNVNDDGGWDPFPATIEEESNGNHYFVVHGKEAITEGDPSQWDNQFWIQSQHEWKAGTQIKIHFRYKASKNVTVATQVHHQKPSDYLIWHAVGDVSFTTEWQEFDKTWTIEDDQAGTWSIAFQLNQNDKEAIDFCFDDLSWKYLQLEEGFFVTGKNTDGGVDFDYDNAIAFEEGTDPDGTPCLVAIVGEIGNPDSYVNQVMISTVRGADAAFMGATLKPDGTVVDHGDWLDYIESGNYKLNLPGTGVWKIYIDTAYGAMYFEMLEGTAKENVPIITNKETIVIEGVERDDLSDTTDNDGNRTGREEEGGTGETWDNQFFIVANRVLQPNEETVLEFDYVATTEAGTTTGTHASPGDYRKNAIPDFTFTTEEQHLKVDYTVPASDWGGNAITDAQSIAFDLAMIKAANTYTIKNVKWYVKDASNDEGKTPENLVNETGTDNFYIKIGAGTAPYTPSGISSVVNDKKVSNVTYNLAGQRVSKGYKGIVIKNGSKYLAK